jgi:hypothetical protein
MVILTQFALPRLYYQLTNDRYPKNVLQKIDLIVRAGVRTWLKLPESSLNAFYLTRPRGGLGLPKFELCIPAQRINMLRKLVQSPDATIHRMTEVFGIADEIKKLETSSKLKVPRDPWGLVRWRHVVENDMNDILVGRSAKAYIHVEANKWLNPKKLLKEADYITACQLRANTYPCKAVLARGRDNRDVLCRHCHLTAETVGHSLGLCPKIKDYRIKRHNTILDILIEKMKKKQIGKSQKSRL